MPSLTKAFLIFGLLGLFLLFVFVGNFFFVKAFKEVAHDKTLDKKQKRKLLLLLLIPVVGFFPYVSYKINKQITEKELTTEEVKDKI
jgi:hypothetical protein